MKKLNVVFADDFVEVPEWNYFEDELVKVFRLNNNERKTLHESTVAHLIAAIPFAAGCDDPFRTAILHLGAYMMELRGFEKYCSHLLFDDSNIMSRLDSISNFKGGDESIKEHGMIMLVLIMLEGYHKSQKKDAETGKYNPLNSGAWDYERIKQFYEAKLRLIKNPLLDGIYYNPILAGVWD